MLVIKRRAGQSVLIGENIEVHVLESSSGRVKLGITAPRETVVLRKEVLLTREQNLIAAQGTTPEAVKRLLNGIQAWPHGRQPTHFVKNLPPTAPPPEESKQTD